MLLLISSYLTVTRLFFASLNPLTCWVQLALTVLPYGMSYKHRHVMQHGKPECEQSDVCMMYACESGIRLVHVYFSPSLKSRAHLKSEMCLQPPRTGTTGAVRISYCAPTAAFISRSTVSCPQSRSLWTRHRLCSNPSKRRRMGSAGSIA